MHFCSVLMSQISQKRKEHAFKLYELVYHVEVKVIWLYSQREDKDSTCLDWNAKEHLIFHLNLHK